MKLIFVNRYFAPDLSATSQILSDLAFHLAAHHDVHVVAGRQLYDDAGAHLPPVERMNGVTVHRVPSSRFGRGALGGRALDAASFHAAAGARLLRLAGRDDVIIAKTDPPLLCVTAAAAARMRGARLVNWIQDLFPEVAECLGVLSRQGPAGASMRRARDGALCQAAANVAIGRRMAHRLEAAGVCPDRIRVIANWSDEEAVRPLPAADNPLRREWGLQGRFVVGYCGNLGRAHDFQTLLGAAHRLRGQTDIVFLFIGGGHHAERLEAEFAAGRLGSLQVRPYQPRIRLAEVLSVPDIHWMSLRPELEGLVVPSKFHGIAAAGRPVVMIGDPDGEIGAVVAQSGCGLALPQGDDLALATAIAELKDNPDRRQAMGRRGRRLAQTRFSRAAALRQWHDLVANLMAETLPARLVAGTPTGAGAAR